jgi:glycosyltransferase involved in cell wall biosynthesis
VSSSSPIVSVVMPVRDGGDYLHDAVQSILLQTHDDFELLLVDDHSRDDALEKLPRDSRVHLLRNSGSGIVDALNTGLGRARGALVARMDADDISLPDRLAVQVEFMQHNPHCGIAGAQVELFSEHPITEGYRRYQRWINGLTCADDIANNIFVECPIPHPTAMFRKSTLERLGGYRDTNWAEDYDLFLRAYAAQIPMGKPLGVLLRWRDHSGRLSRRDSRYRTEKFIQAKAQTLCATRLKNRAAIICGTGKQAVRLCDALRQNGVETRYFVDINPRRIGGRKRDQAVISFAQLRDLKGDALVLGVVGAWDARDKLRAVLLGENYLEGVDFLMAA